MMAGNSFATNSNTNSHLLHLRLATGTHPTSQQYSQPQTLSPSQSQSHSQHSTWPQPQPQPQPLRQPQFQSRAQSHSQQASLPLSCFPDPAYTNSYNLSPQPLTSYTLPIRRIKMEPPNPPRLVDETIAEYPEDPSFESSAPDGRIEMAQDEVDAIIRNKRKVRDPKACYACHRRKVKCDRNLPCDSCVKRDHPELCSYERPTKRRRIALSGTVPPDGDGLGSDQVVQSGPNVTVPKEQWERLNRELQQLRDAAGDTPHRSSDMPPELDDENVTGTISRSDEAEREGIHAPSNQMGTMHLGSKSVLAYMMALGRTKSTQDSARSLLEGNILPKLGLDNESATYPFVDLWSTDSSMQDVDGLCKALPDDALCREFFCAYRDVACTIYPVVPECDVFEHQLREMLNMRHRVEQGSLQLDPNKPFGVSLPWLALVFAVFASGAQSTNRPAKERELTSQVYICCSYQALRMSNFLTHPCLETISASLILGNVLAYNMNPGVAYIFLGMTLRMALSIGLQINSMSFYQHEKWLRGRIWWALAWQDSHFSVSYDRPTSSVLCNPDIPFAEGSTAQNRSYAESMYAIIRLTQQIIRSRSLTSKHAMSWEQIRDYKDEVAAIVGNGTAHLKERSLCIKMTQHLERLALKLHASYITSELCRPALKESRSSQDTPMNTSASHPQSPNSRRKSSYASNQSPPHGSQLPDSNFLAMLRVECVRNLEETVAAYVELHSLSEFAARSWIGIQRAISAAFLLGTLPEAIQEPRIVKLLRDLEKVIAQRTIEDPAFEGMQQADGLSSPGQSRNQCSNTHKDRRMSVGSKPPLAESPHWARSMTKSLKALGHMNSILAGPVPGKSYHAPHAQMMSYNQGLPGMYSMPHSQSGGSNNNDNNQRLGLRTTAPSSGASQHYASGPIQNLKQEQYSPGGGGMGNVGGIMSGTMGGPITPDSTGSSGGGSDWNYANITERALEYVQPALWG